MHVYVVFAHPSSSSFSRAVLESFTRGLREAGHTFEIGDLYGMGFQSEMDETQYLREIGPDPGAAVPEDVRQEQLKIERADGLAFIYPLWWSDCPAKLKGWFDRVLTLGYAYFYEPDNQRRTRNSIRKAHLEETGVAAAMRTITLTDRLLGVGVQEARLEILGGMMPGDDTYRQRNLDHACQLGREF